MNKKLLLTIEVDPSNITSSLDTDSENLEWKYKINDYLAETLEELLERCGLNEEDKKLIPEKIKKIRVWFNHEVSQSFKVYEIKSKPYKMTIKQTYIDYDDQN